LSLISHQTARRRWDYRRNDFRPTARGRGFFCRRFFASSAFAGKGRLAHIKKDLTMRIDLRTLSLASVATTLLAASPASRAAQAVWDIDLNPTNGFGGLTSAWSLTDSDSAAAEWNIFNGYPLDSAPDVLSFGPSPQSVRELGGAAFLTSGGNIYSFAAVTDFQTIVTGYSADPLRTRTVGLRLSSVGTGVDPASVLLGGVVPTVSNLVFDQPFSGSFGGNEQEWLFLWTAVPDVPSYLFDFNSAGSSMSLDQLAMYVSPATVVPVPAAGWLLASALGGLSVWRRRYDARATVA
jgi:hypothetical protein